MEHEFLTICTLDYVDTPYEVLAERSRELMKADPDLDTYYFEHGFTFATDGQRGELNDFWEEMLLNLKSRHAQDKWAILDSPESVFQNIHGNKAQLVPDRQLSRTRSWNKGFTSKRCTTVNAEGIIKVYYDRARSRKNVKFVLGTPVQRLLYGNH